MRQHRARPAARDRGGFTLVELLIALGIALVVFAVVFFLYGAATGMAGLRDRRERTVFAVSDVLRTVRRDIASMLPPADDPACAVKLAPGTAQDAARSDLAFCSLVQTTNAPGRFGIRVERLRFAMLDDAGSPPRFVRISQPLNGPASATAATNTLLANGTGFGVEIYDGAKWYRSWPPPARKDAEKKPVAMGVRITLGVPDGAGTSTNWTAEVAIPVSMVVTSSFQRAAAPAP